MNKQTASRMLRGHMQILYIANKNAFYVVCLVEYVQQTIAKPSPKKPFLTYGTLYEAIIETKLLSIYRCQNDILHSSVICVHFKEYLSYSYQIGCH